MGSKCIMLLLGMLQCKFDHVKFSVWWLTLVPYLLMCAVPTCSSKKRSWTGLTAARHVALKAVMEVGDHHSPAAWVMTTARVTEVPAETTPKGKLPAGPAGRTPLSGTTSPWGTSKITSHPTAPTRRIMITTPHRTSAREWMTMAGDLVGLQDSYFNWKTLCLEVHIELKITAWC